MDDVRNKSDEMLGTISDPRRRSYISAVSVTTKSGIPSFTDTNEMTDTMARLLRTMPYPAAIEARDRHMAEQFFAAWKQADDTEPDPKKIFIRDCWLAASVMRINPATLDMRVRRQAFIKPDGSDFTAIASVLARTHRKPYPVAIRLNSAPEMETWTQRRPNPLTRSHIASYAFHEMSHVEQEIRSYPKDRDTFYSNLIFQRIATRLYAGQFPIYRATLAERQGYMRQESFLSLVRGEEIQTEKTYLARAWHEQDQETQSTVKDAVKRLCELLTPTI